MKVPLSWLKEYLTLNLSPDEIAEVLTLGGLEIEKIERTGSQFSGVVVCKVISCERHPNADKLQVAKVFDGTDVFQIVCGAPNCREGIKTALARIGAALTDESGKAHPIKKSKLRGVESFGMLCSSQELGLSSESEGIIELPQDLVEGTDLSALYSDVIFDISLTPNLGHCMSILGIARELAALLDLELKASYPQPKEDASSNIHQMLQVSIQDKAQCLRYACRLVKNVKVAPSPDWLRTRLESCGIRSLNNIVDIGNYVMLEYGQPLHLFDFNAIEGGKILVSQEPPSPSLTSLDEKSREIPNGVLMICDAKKPLAFAGVMGGLSSAISDSTQDVLIEAAFFTPKAIRNASKQLNLRSESSQRFEKGIDPLGLLRALDKAAFLLQEIAGGACVKGTIDCGHQEFKHKQLRLRVGRTNQMLGTELSVGEMVSLLHRLEITISAEEKEHIDVIVPSYRNDLGAEIDLIEEVGRVYGYHHITRKPTRHGSSTLTNAPIFEFENQIRSRLIAEGLQEFLTCDLISPAMAEIALEMGEGPGKLIPVLYPSSVDQSVLRPTLLPGLLQAVKFNTDHQNLDISAFEIGRIHFKDRDHYKEQSMAGIILTGKKTPYHWSPKPEECDFYDLKGIVENVLNSLKIVGVIFEESHFHHLHPFRQAHIRAGKLTLGVVGEIHPSLSEQLDIGKSVLFAELNLHDLMQLHTKPFHVAELPPYPGSERDWTVTLDENTPIGMIFEAVKRMRTPILEDLILLDLYTSDRIGTGLKNATFRFFYRDKEKTLSMERVEEVHSEIIASVAEKIAKSSDDE